MTTVPTGKVKLHQVSEKGRPRRSARRVSSGGDRQPEHREAPDRQAVDDAERFEAGAVGRPQQFAGVGAEQADGGDRLAERAEHDPQRRHHPRRPGVDEDEPEPEQRDRQQREQQARARTSRNSRAASPAGGRRSAGGRSAPRRSRRRPSAAPPAAARWRRRARGSRSPRRIIRVGTVTATSRPSAGAEAPEDRVDDDRGVGADQRRRDEQRAGADGEQRHRRAAVEGRHRRVGDMGAGALRVADPVDDGGGGDGDEQDDGERPRRRSRAPWRAGPVEGEERGGVGDDPGPHHRGEPVRADVAEGVRGALELPQEGALAAAPGGRGLRR